jgi:hypothetical protein
MVIYKWFESLSVDPKKIFFVWQFQEMEKEKQKVFAKLHQQ